VFFVSNIAQIIFIVGRVMLLF